MTPLQAIDFAIEALVLARNDFDEIKASANRRKDYRTARSVELAEQRVTDNLRQLRMERMNLSSLTT